MQLDKSLITHVVLSDETISLIENDNSRYGTVDKHPTGVEGAVYSLKEKPIEGVEFGKRYFRLCATIPNYKGCEINSYLMKEVERNSDGVFVDRINTNRRRFSVTPNICKNLGVKYEPGYELFPMSYDFVYEPPIAYKHKRTDEIDYNDMSTYPISHSNGKIGVVLVALMGFNVYADGIIVDANGNKYNSSRVLFESLSVSSAIDIRDNNGVIVIKKNDKLPFSVIVNDNGDILHDGAIILNVSLWNDTHNRYIDSSSLRGVRFDDLFAIDIVSTYTISEQYNMPYDTVQKPKRPHTSPSRPLYMEQMLDLLMLSYDHYTDLNDSFKKYYIGL